MDSVFVHNEFGAHGRASVRHVCRTALRFCDQVTKAWLVLLLAPLGATALDAPSRRPRLRTEPLTGMILVEVEAGEFLMGSPADEPLREAQERQHAVRVTRPFELGRYEVTQDEWRVVVGTSPSAHEGCGRCPVENVTFADVGEFVRRLNASSPLQGFRLPTEAEWEMACRAGTATPFALGDTLGPDQANVDGRWPYTGSAAGIARGTTTAVGTFAPNAWGFFDMHGNVWEWVADLHCPYPEGPVRDPLGRCDSAPRVIRGGSWAFGADSARCALRYTHRPQDRGPSLGFRVARDLTPGPGSASPSP
jgi:formylglycine-generating enzyme required for sulfatase activity